MMDVPTPARLLACIAAVVLAPPAALAAQPRSAPADPGRLAAPTDPRTDRGIVQSVSSSSIVLKVLDGSTLVISVGKKTHVLLNGKRATIRDVQPGFVAVVTYEAGKHGERIAVAREIRAFTTTSRPAAFDGDHGTVQSASSGQLVLEAAGSGTLTIAIDKKTKVFLNGTRASILDVEPGFTAVVTRRGGQPPAKAPKPRRKGRQSAGAAKTVWAFAARSGAPQLDQGVVGSLSPDAIVLDEGGTTVQIQLDARTRVYVNGKTASARKVKPGLVAVVRRTSGGSAGEIWAFGRT